MRSRVKRREVLSGLAGGWVLLSSPEGRVFAQADHSTTLFPDCNELLRALKAMRALGEALPSDIERIVLELSSKGSSAASLELERQLAPYTLINLRLSSEGVGHSTLVDAAPELCELGWRSFLVRVENPAGLR